MKLLFSNKLVLNPSNSPEPKQNPVQDPKHDNNHSAICYFIFKKGGKKKQSKN